MTKSTHAKLYSVLICLSILAACVGISRAHADDREFPFPGEVRVCQPVVDPEYRDILVKLAAQIRFDINCGGLENLIRDSRQLHDLATQLAKRAPNTTTGNCFSKLNCGRPKLGGGWVSEAACKTAGGESWQQQSPTTGTCINI